MMAPPCTNMRARCDRPNALGFPRFTVLREPQWNTTITSFDHAETGPTIIAASACGRRAGSSFAASRRTIAFQCRRSTASSITRRARSEPARNAAAHSGLDLPAESNASTSNAGPSL